MFANPLSPKPGGMFNRLKDSYLNGTLIKKNPLGSTQGIDVPPRYYDPALAAKARESFANTGISAGMGQYNRILQGLRNAGLGRSAGMFNAAGAAAATQGRVTGDLNQQYALNEQNFTEGARQFDVNTILALKNLLARMQEIQNNKPPDVSISTPFGGISF